jgi:hypothetical protein
LCPAAALPSLRHVGASVVYAGEYTRTRPIVNRAGAAGRMQPPACVIRERPAKGCPCP